MTDVSILQTEAEKNAELAEGLDAFGGLNVQYIKKQTEKILQLIGRGGIFEEYTYHDISHINTMLNSLDWIIPESTKKVMSPSDWLLIVLAIYFHDMGMLVTSDEYEARGSSGFTEFKQSIISGDKGRDLIDKLAQLNNEKKEKFIYQEFVRQNHAKRIKSWIEGKGHSDFGISKEIVHELDQLLSPLGEVFREDLALICESHHLDDLTNFNKYKVSKPYGNSIKETANLQYAAILLRTADLLHITKDRTPTVSFNIINPSDPISQDEWAKQMAVRSVRPAPGKDKNGRVNNQLQSNTIEVHASFSKKDGFFGLTSYLDYAEIQMEKSYKSVKLANEKWGSTYEFPWRKIDQDHIETSGFLKEPFNFVLDPKKILDLLTGHTLYNDSSVVIRELIQNSLDAIRLQQKINPKSIDSGKVVVNWDSTERLLTVKDNGTGMTQEVIENYFLRAGVSRYQDPKFKEKFPSFSPISRFGIGILSTFMIADNIDVITTHPEEEKGRHISLRTVHGKYLIELLDKSSQEILNIGDHGTEIKLKVRPSVNMGDVLNTVQKWILFPETELIVIIDGERFDVGYSSPKEAVKEFLIKNGYSEAESTLGRYKIDIKEKEIDGLKIAYAVKWSDYFKEWSFLTLSEDEDIIGDINNRKENLLGMCIEGIRVEFVTPGFTKNRIIAIGNVKGQNGPKTNVAREGIEHTQEYEDMLRVIYSIYCEHVEDQMTELQKSYSLTWVVRESQVLLEPLINRNGRINAVNETMLLDEVNKISTLIAETDGKREAISPNTLRGYENFCTIQSILYSNLESLVRELPSNASISEITKNVKIANYEIPSGTILSERQNALFQPVLESMDVKKITINKEFRSVELYWGKPDDEKNWIVFSGNHGENAFYTYNHRINRNKKLFIANEKVDVIGLEDEVGVIQGESIFLLHGSNINKYCKELLSDRGINKKYSDRQIVFILNIISYTITRRVNQENVELVLERFFRDSPNTLRKELEDEGHLEEMKSVLLQKEIDIYDPLKWIRSETYLRF
ncbi:ATP-binding protein [uncultured Rossellomorea sp.]|uniref:HD domain-containing protein n=1 Tax=uncultured Rossellomorea sp. TaxID=2837549 RepID=UPI0026058BC3|nr:ATP-binding protein [uncultured Rossellomorea sp.]